MSAILAAGANKNQAKQTGVTPIYIAAQEGHAAVVSTLLAAGADKDAAKNDGATPVLIAAQEGHEAVVSMLLAAGADKDAGTLSGATPFFMAAQHGHLLLIVESKYFTFHFDFAEGKNTMRSVNYRQHIKIRMYFDIFKCHFDKIREIPRKINEH